MELESRKNTGRFYKFREFYMNINQIRVIGISPELRRVGFVIGEGEQQCLTGEDLTDAEIDDIRRFLYNRRETA